MSLRRKVSHFLALVVVAALAIGLMAGPASAKVSAKQKVAIRAQLRKAVKKNPGVIGKKWFMKKASLVNFTLPVTIRLRGSSTPANPNQANVDLGPSLGQREIDLGGSLAAQIQFHDSFDGGALGNVDLSILPSATKSLTSTSIPLLWNHQVSDPTTSWDSNLLGNPAGYPGPGCGNVHTANGNVNGNLPFGAGVLPTLGGPGLAGVPIYPDLATYAAHGTPVAFAPAHVASTGTANNDINGVNASKIPGNSDNVGGNPSPFPSGSAPGGFTQPPSTADTVLRTNALNLGIAQAGTAVNMSNGPDGGGPQGSQDITLGKSGGQANLFGNIPGKQYGIDVTVNLSTKISSIFRVVDQDAFAPLIAGGNWPAAVFSCGQIWSGFVQNYIPAVHLVGSLKIAPAITADGHLRIAKATISSPSGESDHIALAACLAPYAAYNAQQNSSDTVTPTVPGAASIGFADGSLALGSLPVDPNNVRPAPNVPCNTTPTAFVASTAASPFSVTSLSPAAPGDGYTTTNSGAQVSVAGDLHVNNVSVDVLVGDV